MSREVSKEQPKMEYRSHALDFDELRAANLARSDDFIPVNDWSPTDWATAVAGEFGEACNIIKKMRRGEVVSLEAIGFELADAVMYIDLLAARLGIDLGEVTWRKFNVVSERIGSRVRL